MPADSQCLAAEVLAAAGGLPIMKLALFESALIVDGRREMC